MLIDLGVRASVSSEQNFGQGFGLRILINCVSICRAGRFHHEELTYNGNLSAEVVFDFARLDGIWGVFMDDVGELYESISFSIQLTSC